MLFAHLLSRGSNGAHRTGHGRNHRQPQCRLAVEPLEERYLLSRSFGPWSDPVSLGPTINSPTIDQHPALSKDGLSLYFISDRPGGVGDWDIWVSQRDRRDEPWGAPVNLGGVVNSSSQEHAPALSRDGHWLFFHSSRPGGHGGLDIYASYRTHSHDDFDWGPPVNLGPGVNSTYDEAGPTHFQDDNTEMVTLYFTSLNRPGGVGDWDVYASIQEADGSFGPAVLVPELSSPGRDTRTAISGDGLEMFVTSNRPGGAGGIDVWVSTRPTTLDPWSTPVNLGPTVNSASNDGAPTLSRDGRTLIFYSNRPGGLGDNDLYVSTRARHPGSAANGDDGDFQAVNLGAGAGGRTAGTSPRSETSSNQPAVLILPAAGAVDMAFVVSERPKDRALVVSGPDSETQEWEGDEQAGLLVATESWLLI